MDLALANLVVALYLTGLIWTVQVVHYPLFALVGRDSWTAYEASHRTRITAVVAAPMLAGLAVALALLLTGEGNATLRAANLVLTAVPFAATFTHAVPRHEALTAAWDGAAHRALVRVNWLRTVTWTAQAAVALVLVRSLA